MKHTGINFVASYTLTYCLVKAAGAIIKGTNVSIVTFSRSETGTSCGPIGSDSVESFIFTCQTV